ncbi:hypothetical protein ACE1SV_00440 [Streptomyces sennicomposti]
MACPEQYTEEGREWQFATNHLGHFALATGLHDALAADGNARIVVVSSAGHQRSPIVWDDVNFAFRPYDPWLAYGQSKTANVFFAVEATRRWADDNITANALMPGAIYTNLQRHTGGRGSGSVSPSLWAAAPKTRKFSTRECAKYTDSPADVAAVPSSPERSPPGCAPVIDIFEILCSPGSPPGGIRQIAGDKDLACLVGPDGRAPAGRRDGLACPGRPAWEGGPPLPADLALLAYVESKE